jgi:hypothetical protein
LDAALAGSAAQVCCALIFNAVALVSSFNALVVDINGRKQLFSDKAVRRVKGVQHLMVRIGELRSHQLIEATVRVLYTPRTTC